MDRREISGIAHKGVPLGLSVDEGELDALGLDPARGMTATPIATLDRAVLTANAAAMQAWCDRHGAALAPHAKTGMSAQLVRLQLEHGAWGMTAALPRQAAQLWAFGVERVLIANEVTDPAAAIWLARAATEPGRGLLLYVDSPEGVALLDAALAAEDLRLDVLVEIGYAGGRTGARGLDAAMATAEAVLAAPRLRLAGTAGYEGGIGGALEPGVLARVDTFLTEIAALTRELGGRFETPEPVVTAGGSVFFDRVVRILGPAAADVGGRLVVRAGCTLIHDHGLYARTDPAARAVEGAPEFAAALSVWARVVSTPEPGLALLDAGRRDVSFDSGLPVPLERWRDGAALPLPAARIAALSDQHAFLEHEAGLDVRLGDVVRLGISHPCTTLDRFRRIFLVEDGSRITGSVATQF